jgi:hypothetical protein
VSGWWWRGAGGGRGKSTLAHVDAAVRRFTAGATEVFFNMIHILSASFLATGIANPRVVIRNRAGAVVKTVDSGDVLSAVPVSDWLAYAGVSLEDRNVNPWLRNGDVAAQPRFRATGVVLLVRMAYTNLRTFELPTLGVGAPQVSELRRSLPAPREQLCKPVAVGCDAPPPPLTCLPGARCRWT